MRILDENDQEVTDPDLELGHLVKDQIFVQHHDAIPEQLPVKELDYDNPIWVGSNGGKIVEEKLISPYQPPVDAWDEYEDIYRYVLYTEEELAEIQAQKEAEEQAKEEAEAQAKEEAQKQEIEKQTMMQMRTVAMFSVMTMSLTDDQANEVSTLIPEWSVGDSYKEDDIRRYQGNLYRALQASTGQSQYPPDSFTSGWKRIGEPNEEGIYPWVQPLGATDAYNDGDKVTYGGYTWTSDIDGNVWAPGVYGWTKEEEKEPEDQPTEPEEPTVEEWVQPTGAHDAYSAGDVVSHNGKTWKSDISSNVWEPGVYGWSEVTE